MTLKKPDKFVKVSRSWMRGVERGKERKGGRGGWQSKSMPGARWWKKMKERNRDVKLAEVGRTNGRQPGVILIATVSLLMVSVAFVLVQWGRFLSCMTVCVYSPQKRVNSTYCVWQIHTQSCRRPHDLRDTTTAHSDIETETPDSHWPFALYNI